MSNPIYVFGLEENINWLTDEVASDLLLEANEKAKTASRPDIECILDILENVSQAWTNPDYHLRENAVNLLSEHTSFSKQMIEAGLNTISFICSKTSLEKRLSGEIGNIDVFNEGDNQPHLNYKLKAYPNGVVLHINNDNNFVTAIDSLISGIITKNANIFKISNKNQIFPALFLESIKEFDPAGIIWPNQAIVHWNDGNISIEKILLAQKLTIIFGGSQKYLQYLKSLMNKQTKLIDNGQKYSLAVIEGKCLKPTAPASLIRGLAVDICQWDQKAYSSPQVVYVIDKDLKTSHQLIEALFDEMIQMSEELPSGRLNFNEKVEIRKIREIARMKQVRSEGRLVCPEEFDFTLVLEYTPSFKISCSNRTLYIKRIGNIEDLIEQIEPFSEYLQTVGLCCTDDSFQLYEKELFGVGIKRITDIGKMNRKLNGTPYNGYFTLRSLVKWLSVEHESSVIDNGASSIEE